MMTGAEYKESLVDGRATFFEGKRVDDLPAHPILGPPVERVADDYDWLLTQAVDGQPPSAAYPRPRRSYGPRSTSCTTRG